MNGNRLLTRYSTSAPWNVVHFLFTVQIGRLAESPKLLRGPVSTPFDRPLHHISWLEGMSKEEDDVAATACWLWKPRIPIDKSSTEYRIVPLAVLVYYQSIDEAFVIYFWMIQTFRHRVLSQTLPSANYLMVGLAIRGRWSRHWNDSMDLGMWSTPLTIPCFNDM